MINEERIVTLGSKKGLKNDKSYSQLYRLYNSLLMSTVDTHEKD